LPSNGSKSVSLLPNPPSSLELTYPVSTVVSKNIPPVATTRIPDPTQPNAIPWHPLLPHPYPLLSHSSCRTCAIGCRIHGSQRCNL
jgi:hypothetical protein